MSAEVQPVPDSVPMSIVADVAPGIRDILKLMARARVIVAAMNPDSLPSDARYAVTSELPCYIKTIEDKLAGVVWRLS